MGHRPNRRRMRVATVMTLVLTGSLASLKPGPAIADEAGSLDPSFGTGGVAARLFTDSHSGISDVALQSDGKVVVAGWTDGSGTSDFAVARLTASGQPDPTFGGDGTVATHLGGSEEAHAVLSQTDGKIVAVGARVPFSQGGRGFQFVRYLANGALDSTFSGDGKLIVSGGAFGSGLDRAYAAALQPDGKIVAAGRTTSGDVGVVRLTTSGTLDRTFSGNGIAALDSGGYEVAFAVGMQPDGKVVIGGSHHAGLGGFQALVGRFTTTGAVDTSFGDGGSTITQFDDSFRPITDLVVQPDAKIAVAGGSFSGNDTKLTVARYTANGQLDAGFSQDGVATANLLGSDRATAIVQQADGKLVAIGYIPNGGGLILARYLVDGSPDPTFGTNGVRQFRELEPGGFADAVVQPDGRLVLGCCGAAARFLMSVAPPQGPLCDGLPATIVGTAGNDSLTGTAGADVIVGGAGNDTINGAAGADRICAGEGADLASGGPGDDRIFGELGGDQLYGITGADHVDGGDGVDVVDFNFATGPIIVDLVAGSASGEGADTLVGLEGAAGGPHADDLRGDAAANRLVGRGGNDLLDGREGDDVLAGSSGNDQLAGGLGTDVLSLSSATGSVQVDLSAGTAQGEGSDTTTGVEQVIGSRFADVLAGDGLSNVLNAGAGNDRILGLGGNDVLLGGEGGDDLSGGAGSDRCDGGANASGASDVADATCEVQVGIP